MENGQHRRRWAREGRSVRRKNRSLRLEQLEARDCRSTLSIASFGAVGDDSRSDGDAIQAAIAAARPGDKILIPKGTYLVDQTVVVDTQGLKIKGSGKASVIRAQAPTFNIFHVNSDNVTFDRLNFQGAATPESTSANKGNFAIYTDIDSTASKGKVRNSFFSGPNSTTGLNNGIKLETGSNNWTVTGNTFERLIGVVSGNGYGILVGASSEHLFKENRFSGALGQGRHAIYLSGGASNSRVSMNVVEKFNESSIAVYSRSYQPACTANLVIANRIIDQRLGSTGSAGIELSGNVQSNVVQRNTILRPGRAGIVVTASNEGDLARDNVISNNRIEGAGQFGILIEGALRTTVRGNCIYDASLESADVYSAIQVQADNFSREPRQVADGNVIDGNLITGLNGSVHYRWGISLNETVPAPTNSSITNNQVTKGQHGATDVVLESLPTTFLFGNRIEQEILKPRIRSAR